MQVFLILYGTHSWMAWRIQASLRSVHGVPRAAGRTALPLRKRLVEAQLLTWIPRPREGHQDTHLRFPLTSNTSHALLLSDDPLLSVGGASELMGAPLHNLRDKVQNSATEDRSRASIEIHPHWITGHEVRWIALMKQRFRRS